MAIVVASCVNPPAFAYVIVGRYFSSLGPLIASAQWSSIPRRWYELGGFIGPPPRPHLASVLLVSPVVLVVVSPLHLLLVLAWPTLLSLVSPLLLLLLLVISPCASFSRCLSPPDRLVPPAPPRLASPPPPRLASPPPPHLTPAPCHLTPPHCCRVALWIRPSGMSSLRALSLSGSLPSSSLPGPYIDRD